MKLTKRNIEALVEIAHGSRVKGSNSGGAIARMHDRLEKAGLIEWRHGYRFLTVEGQNVVADDEARVALLAEQQA